MELNITELLSDPEGMIDYSASIAEIGEDAGSVTWRNAVQTAEELPLLTEQDQIDEVRDYVREFGAWDDAEIDSWSDVEVNALLLQLIAGDIRERQHYVEHDEMDEYEETIGGRIYGADDSGWFFYVGM